MFFVFLTCYILCSRQMTATHFVAQLKHISSRQFKVLYIMHQIRNRAENTKGQAGRMERISEQMKKKEEE